MEIIRLDNNRVWLSESKDPDALYAKFLICDFGVNLNGVQLERSTIENWIETLKDEPLVGKIVIKADGSKDFTGHNAKFVKRVDDDGNEYQDVEFDTSAFGTFIDVGIEEVDGAECIVATAKCWRRFHDAAELIEKRCVSGSLHTSWEVGVNDYTMKIENGSAVKVITDGRFLGHCMLGKGVTPAYGCSGLLDVAELDEDSAVIDAILNDTYITANKENPMEDPIITPEEAEKKPKLEEPKEDPAPAEDPAPDEPAPEEPDADSEKKRRKCGSEVSALTDWDLRRKISDACQTVLKNWCYVAFWFPVENTVWVKSCEDGVEELEYVLFTYSITNDENVVLSDPTPVKLTVSVSEVNEKFAALTETCAQANTEIERLKAENEALSPYKAEHDAAVAEKEKAEHEVKVAEMKQYVVDSKRFTEKEIESEEIAELINNLDKTALSTMIAERLVNELRKTPETSSTNESAPEKKQKHVLLFTEEPSDKAKVIRDFLRG